MVNTRCIEQRNVLRVFDGMLSACGYGVAVAKYKKEIHRGAICRTGTPAGVYQGPS